MSFVFVACGGDESPAPRAIVADSAGVRIVTNTAELSESVPVWRLSEQPVFTVGVAEGEPEYVLHNVTDAARLPDGGMVLVSAGTSDLRRYDAAGRFVQRYGRAGTGPGEFRAPARVIVVADSIHAWDQMLRRGAVFTMDGRFVRQVLLGRPSSNPYVEALVDDGSMLVSDERFAIPISGFADATFTIARYRADGSFVDSGGTHFLTRVGNLGEIGGVGSPVFAPRGVRAAWRGGYWIGSGQDYEVRAFDASGSLTQVIRWAGPARRVDPSLVTAYWDARLRGATGQGRERLELLRSVMPVAEQLPPYTRAIASAEGMLWVLAFRHPGATGPDIWWVFDHDGVLAARAEIPVRFRITEIVDGQLTGVERDEDGVERVRIYRVAGSGMRDAGE